MLPYALLSIVAVIITHGMWQPALLWGHSAWMDFVRMLEFDSAIRGGDYLPTWSPDLYHGYGSPLFQFYAPLVYYVVEMFALAGLGLVAALKMTQVLLLAASGCALYRLATAHVSDPSAFVAGLLYMVAPYRFINMYERHALAEHAAFLWLPLLIGATARFTATRSRSSLAVGALASCGLVLTHNITALIALPVGVAAGWFLVNQASWRQTARAMLPAMLGVGLATFFWWPALSGRDLTHAEQSLTGGHFDYHRHFVSAGMLFDPGLSLTAEASENTPGLQLQLGGVHVLAAAGAIALLMLSKRSRWLMTGVIITLGALAMCHSISRPLWEAVPLLKYVQFPWRFLGLATLGGAICAAGALDWLCARERRFALPSAAAVSAAALLAYASCFGNQRFLVAQQGANSLAIRSGAETSALNSGSNLLPVEGFATIAKMRAVGARATSQNDFLPRGVKQQPTAEPTTPFSVINGQVLAHERLGVNQYRVTAELDAPGAVVLNQFWFPGWRVTYEGKVIDPVPHGELALAAQPLPRGRHVVEFAYSALPQRQTGMLVSLISLVLLLVLVCLRSGLCLIKLFPKSSEPLICPGN